MPLYSSLGWGCGGCGDARTRISTYKNRTNKRYVIILSPTDRLDIPAPLCTKGLPRQIIPQTRDSRLRVLLPVDTSSFRNYFSLFPPCSLSQPTYSHTLDLSRLAQFSVCLLPADLCCFISCGLTVVNADCYIHVTSHTSSVKLTVRRTATFLPLFQHHVRHQSFGEIGQRLDLQ